MNGLVHQYDSNPLALRIQLMKSLLTKWAFDELNGAFDYEVEYWL